MGRLGTDSWVRILVEPLLTDTGPRRRSRIALILNPEYHPWLPRSQKHGGPIPLVGSDGIGRPNAVATGSMNS